MTSRCGRPTTGTTSRPTLASGQVVIDGPHHRQVLAARRQPAHRRRRQPAAQGQRGVRQRRGAQVGRRGARHEPGLRPRSAAPLLLALLDDGPRHGYEVIQDLEHRFNGLYSPSAGTVYPRLAKLEEEGLVERTDEGRKAVYRITEAGRAEVRDRQDDLSSLEADLDLSVRELAEQVRSRVRGQTSDLRAELRAAAQEARRTATPVGRPRGVGRRPTRRRRTVRRPRSGRPAAASARPGTAWKRHGLTSEQTHEIVDILGDATSRIREVVQVRTMTVPGGLVVQAATVAVPEHRRAGTGRAAPCAPAPGTAAPSCRRSTARAGPRRGDRAWSRAVLTRRGSRPRRWPAGRSCRGWPRPRRTATGR